MRVVLNPCITILSRLTLSRPNNSTQLTQDHTADLFMFSAKCLSVVRASAAPDQSGLPSKASSVQPSSPPLPKAPKIPSSTVPGLKRERAERIVEAKGTNSRCVCVTPPGLLFRHV